MPNLPLALLHVCRGNVGRICWEIEQDADALQAQWVREGRLKEPVRRFCLDGDVLLVGAGGSYEAGVMLLPKCDGGDR